MFIYRNQQQQKQKHKQQQAKGLCVTNVVPVQQVAPTTQVNKKAYTGTHPLCNTCNYHHLLNHACRMCTNCNRWGHLANACRSSRVQINQPNVPLLAAPNAPPVARACFQCGALGHFANVFPQRANRFNAPNNAANQANQGARARVFNVNANQAQSNNDVVNGTFLINGLYASMLFDTGADKSFVSLEFEPLLATPRTKLDEPFTVEVANGKTVHLNSFIPNCTLNLNEYNFSIDLIPMRLGSFDIIVVTL